MSDKCDKIINLADYRKKKEEPKEILDIPTIEDFISVMEMSTDDIVAELVYRLQTKEAISKATSDALVSELAARLIQMEDICIASVVSELEKK